ncbi:MAG TPA: asparagine synthase-related protein [Pyrinomonadaceae bacterium]
MSAFGGILNFDRGPVDPVRLQRLQRSLEAYGPDGGNAVYAGRVGMTYHALNVTAESRFEYQPHDASTGQLLVWDGRLDNRDDLISQLDLQKPATDLAIVAAAYLKWGTRFPEQLIGDFALGIWDERTQTLILARDPFGVRSLFYHQNKDRIIWSTILNELIDVVDVELTVDDNYIAGFLTRYPEPWQTPYRNFQAVPPGHTLIVKDGEVRSTPFWKPDPHTQLQYKNSDEYAEQFRELLSQSVRGRLRSSAPVFAELSGGLDSSSIVCVADYVRTSDDASLAEVETVSYVYDEAKTSDERSFMQSVELQRGKPGHYINEDEHRFSISAALDQFFSAPSYHFYNLNRFGALRNVMSRYSSSVVMSGEGGDQLNMANPDPDVIIADYLYRFEPVVLHNLLSGWSRELHKPYLQLLRSGAALLLPRSIQARYRKVAKAPSWLDRNFCRRMNISDRMLGPTDPYGFRLPSQSDAAQGLIQAIRTISAIYFQEYSGVNFTFPYLHRPLVEFLLAVPVEEKIRGGVGRVLVRKALRGILPDKVANRRGKKGPTEALSNAIIREWSSVKWMFDEPRVSANGYVDRDELLAAVQRVRHGTEKFSFHLFVTLATEFWLRSLERRPVAAGNLNPELIPPDHQLAPAFAGP